MKCSDCRLWKTEGCRNNPDGADLNGVENYPCFIHASDARDRVAVDDTTSNEQPPTQAKEEFSNKAYITGLILISIAVILFFIPVVMCAGESCVEDTIPAMRTLMVLGPISLVILLVGVAILADQRGKRKACDVARCSDCRFWQTDECKTNPDKVNFNCANEFACFQPKQQTTAEQ